MHEDGMRLASESAKEEETRLSGCRGRDRARRAAQSSQATKNCRGSETERRLYSESADISAYFILHVHVPTITCLLLRTLYIYTSHIHYAVLSLSLANNAMHSPSIWKNLPSCTTRLARSRSPITVAAHKRQHAHKIATSDIDRDRYRRKMRLASESAEEEETRLPRRRGRDRASAAQSSQATKNCRGSETAITYAKVLSNQHYAMGIPRAEDVHIRSC